VLWVARVPVAHLATAAPPIAEQTQRYLTIVGPTLALLGPALAAVVILQQTGAGRLALVLNLPYYATMALLGGALARHTHRPDALYATIAALNLIGLPVVLACLRRHTIRPRPATPRPLEV
jgi:Na+-driven multidrug efflux pump